MGILYAWKHSTLVKLVRFMWYAPVETASSAHFSCIFLLLNQLTHLINGLVCQHAVMKSQSRQCHVTDKVYHQCILYM